MIGLGSDKITVIFKNDCAFTLHLHFSDSFVQRDSWSQSRCIDLWSHVPFLQVTQRVSHITSHITVELRIMNFKTRFSRKTSFQTVLSFSNTQVSFPRNLRRKFHINLLHVVLFYYLILPQVTLNAYKVMFISDICLKLTYFRWQSLVIETPWVTSPSSRTFPRMLPPRMPWER